MAESRPAISLEYLPVAISGDVELDDQPVRFAFMPDGAGSPGDDDWITAAWTGDAGMTRTARLLVGPEGDYVPVPGGVVGWYKVTDDPEIPARPFGYIRFT